jgi:hypothetical protein
MNPTYSFGKINVTGIILNTELAFYDIFYALSIFLFKKSFLETFLLPEK